MEQDDPLGTFFAQLPGKKTNMYITHCTEAYSILIKTFGKPGWQACQAGAQAVVEQPSLPAVASLYDPPEKST